MALYEYRCMACGHVTELFRRVDACNFPAHCEQCGKAARRIYSVPQKWNAAWSTQRDPEELRKADELWEK